MVSLLDRSAYQRSTYQTLTKQILQFTTYETEKDDITFDIKAKGQNDFKAPDMEYTTSIFTANIQSNSYETRLNSALDVGSDMIYRTYFLKFYNITNCDP